MNISYMFKNQSIKLFLILGVILFSLFEVSGCSNANNSFDTNNEKYRYLYEEDYGENSIVIIHNTDELLQQNLSTNFILTKYDETYFVNNYLLLFHFNKYYEESNLKVKDTKITNDNQLLINISIDSPADYEHHVFDAQISTELLFVDIPKSTITKIENLRVGILVINTKFEDVYCSVYYNSQRMNN